MKRRRFLAVGGSALAGALLAPRARILGQGLARSRVVETSAGRLGGLSRDGVLVLRGVRYARPPVGALRFMPPAPVEPWTGVRDATQNGPRAYQPFRPMIPEIGDALTGTGPMGEDCLHLNVWAPDDGAGGRPVMVWFHGGGFRTGSANSVYYDGEALARTHGVVVVTVNHRLNAFGYLDLSALGNPRYGDGSNAGMRDLVMALTWVRDNIAAVGGDPGNVTAFGQSGGGGKVGMLSGMPAAAGLFHRAIIMSTLIDNAVSARDRNLVAGATTDLLARLGLRADQVDALQQVPAERILEAMTAGTGRSGGQSFGDQPPPEGDLSLEFSPVIDGRSVVRHPFEPDASPLTAAVPVLCGSNETDGVIPYGDPGAAYWSSAIADRAALHAWVRSRFGVDGADADGLIDLYRRNRPDDSFDDLSVVMDADNSLNRVSANMIAERKSAQGTAPAYLYFFRWRTPVRGGKLRSMHCLELPFVFDHVDDVPMLTGVGEERYALARQMSEAWVAFARTGSPSRAGLPWPAFNAAERPTMVFDTESRVVNDPFGEERRAMEAMRASRV